MITDFEDLCLWMYCIVDDIWKTIEIQPSFQRPGPAPSCSDSELITMTLIGECKGWDTETTMLSEWRARKSLGLFPHVPSQSRFNRRRRSLMYGFNMVRQVVLRMLDLAADRQCVIEPQSRRLCLTTYSGQPIARVRSHLLHGSYSAAHVLQEFLDVACRIIRRRQ